jgi:hypothetical protein
VIVAGSPLAAGYATEESSPPGAPYVAFAISAPSSSCFFGLPASS